METSPGPIRHREVRVLHSSCLVSKRPIKAHSRTAHPAEAWQSLHGEGGGFAFAPPVGWRWRGARATRPRQTGQDRAVPPADTGNRPAGAHGLVLVRKHPRAAPLRVEMRRRISGCSRMWFTCDCERSCGIYQHFPEDCEPTRPFPLGIACSVCCFGHGSCIFNLSSLGYNP